ncbi:MAG: glycosyltransferase family 4 protein [Desulfobacteraceae bacterium]|nr:glycosyltransferase family 4 protein [Desulfobacteraceae bacterium]
MKILLANKYFYIKGGAETYLFSIADMLKRKGHKINYFSMHHKNNFDSPDNKYFVRQWNNHDLSFSNILAASSQLLYSFEAKNKIRRLLADYQPDIVHLNNIYHQLSPSIIHAVKNYGVPMVMTIHDLKLVCAVYALYTRGRICEACKNGRYFNCAINTCVKGSILKSCLGTLEMYLHHSFLKIYNHIDIFIAPSLFIKNKILELGFKGEIVYLPNFVNLEQFIPDYQWKQRSVIYFGRLVGNKGVLSLINAVKTIDGIELKIIGQGPLKKYIQEKIRTENISNVRLLGFKTGQDLHTEIKNSMFVIVPSQLYENNPLSVIEAFSLGKPVIGSDIGGIPELVQNNRTGFTFNPESEEDLRDKIITLSKDPEMIVKMGTNARKLIEKKLNAGTYYKSLKKIYQRVLGVCD